MELTTWNFNIFHFTKGDINIRSPFQYTYRYLKTRLLPSVAFSFLLPFCYLPSVQHSGTRLKACQLTKPALDLTSVSLKAECEMLGVFSFPSIHSMNLKINPKSQDN